jgi:hypothetical protein
VRFSLLGYGIQELGTAVTMNHPLPSARQRIKGVIIYFVANMKDNMLMHSKYHDGAHDKVPK